MVNPFWLFGLLGVGGAVIGAAAFSLLIHPLLAWLIAVNLVALALYRYDKSVAGSRRTRVPERILLLLEGIGGTAGAAIAMWLVRPRHKTQSPGFLFWFFSILVLQVTSLFLYYGFVIR
jgi:uncharacterized membrane protein YsdA (DUF1294 family)